MNDPILVDDAAILSRYDQQIRAKPQVSQADRAELDGAVIRVVGPTPDTFENCVKWCADPELDSAIRRQVARFEAIGHAFHWKVLSHDSRQDLPLRLAAHGLRENHQAALMVFDVGRVESDSRPSSFTIQRVTEPGQLGEFREVSKAVWGQDSAWLREGLRREFEAAPAQVSVYLAHSDSQPVGCAWARFRADDFVELFGGSTLPAYRRQGIYSALVRARAVEAHRRKRRWLVVEAGSASQPILLKQGFRQLATIACWVYEPSTPSDGGQQA